MRGAILSNLSTEIEAASHGHIDLANEKTSEFCIKKTVYGKSWDRKKALGYTQAHPLEEGSRPDPWRP